MSAPKLTALHFHSAPMAADAGEYHAVHGCAHVRKSWASWWALGTNLMPNGRQLSLKIPKGIVHIENPTFHVIRSYATGCDSNSSYPAADTRLDNGLSVRIPMASRICWPRTLSMPLVPANSHKSPRVCSFSADGAQCHFRDFSITLWQNLYCPLAISSLCKLRW